MLTDFFVATTAEVHALDMASGPSAQVQCVRAKRTDPVKIVQLLCCIEGVPFEQRMALLNTMLVRDAGQEGPWVFRLPEALESALASSGASAIGRYGRAWAATEEWQRDGGTPEQIVPLLGEIARLASSARTQERSVFVWMSL